jgi:8-oxo-dGTP pyrophosphatase MutT (NUDIX family)
VVLEQVPGYLAARDRLVCSAADKEDMIPERRTEADPHADLSGDLRHHGLAPVTPFGLEQVRSRLRDTCPPASLRDVVPPLVPAAVLIGLVGRPGGPTIILTHRTANLRHHPAQISLPGGRVEATDGGPVAAALRETSEEIGLAPERVEILGCLHLHETVTGFVVFPIVGWIEPPIDFVPDVQEVSEVFEVPLKFVLDQANHLRDSIVHEGTRRSFFVLPYPGHRIWGATAGILVDLAGVLSEG